MQCRITDLKYKEVINVCDGFRFGFISDVLVDVSDGKIAALVIPGPYRFLGILGREDDYVIGWDKIVKMGEDIVLVDVKGEHRHSHREKRSWI